MDEYAGPKLLLHAISVSDMWYFVTHSGLYYKSGD